MKKPLLSIFLAVLLLPALGCTADIPPGTPEYILSLQADDCTALLTMTGRPTVTAEPVTLSAPPRILEDTFYFPLTDVVSVLGGSCQINGTTVQVSLFGQETSFTAGESTAQWNGAPWTPEDSAAVPRQWEGRLYLPLSYARLLLPEDALSTRTLEDPEHGIAILGGELSADVTLAGLQPFGKYQDLPEEVRRDMRETKLYSDPYEDGAFDMVQYENGNLRLYVLQKHPGGPELSEIGNFCGIELLSDAQATPRGLRVGDTAEQARRLYGAIQDLGNGIYTVEEQFSLIYKLQFQVESGTIRRIGLYGTFWSMP